MRGCAEEAVLQAGSSLRDGSARSGGCVGCLSRAGPSASAWHKGSGTLGVGFPGELLPCMRREPKSAAWRTTGAVGAVATIGAGLVFVVEGLHVRYWDL